MICLGFIFIYSQSNFNVYKKTAEESIYSDNSDDIPNSTTPIESDVVDKIPLSIERELTNSTPSDFTLMTDAIVSNRYRFTFNVNSFNNISEENAFRVQSAFVNLVPTFNPTLSSHSIYMSNLGSTMSTVTLDSDLLWDNRIGTQTIDIPMSSSTQSEGSTSGDLNLISSVIGQGSQSYHTIHREWSSAIECVGILQSWHLDDDYGSPEVYGFREPEYIPFGQSKGCVVILKDSIVLQRLYSSTTSVPRLSQHTRDIASDQYGYHIGSIQKGNTINESDENVEDMEAVDIFLFVSGELTYDTVRLGRIDVWQLTPFDSIQHNEEQFIRRSVITVRDVLENRVFQQLVNRIYGKSIEHYTWRISARFECFDQHVIVQCLMFETVEHITYNEHTAKVLDRFLCIMHIDSNGRSYLVRILDHNVITFKSSPNVLCYLKGGDNIEDFGEVTSLSILNVYDTPKSVLLSPDFLLPDFFDISIDAKYSSGVDIPVFLHTYNGNTVEIIDLTTNPAMLISDANYNPSMAHICIKGICHGNRCVTIITSSSTSQNSVDQAFIRMDVS